MLRVRCDICLDELDKPGGLAFSPPDVVSEVTKFHLCIGCWGAFRDWAVAEGHRLEKEKVETVIERVVKKEGKAKR